MTERRDADLDERVKALYRRGDPRDAAAAARALARVQSEPQGRPGVLAFLLAPRRVTLRPAVALAAAAVLLAAGALAGMRFGHSTRPTATADAGLAASAPANPPAAAGTVPVVFALCTRGASRVTVAGDFNGWDADATPLVRAGGDVWMVRVNVPRGVHRYSFVLDGSEWRPDPAAPLSADPVFGARNSILVAGGSTTL